MAEQVLANTPLEEIREQTENRVEGTPRAETDGVAKKKKRLGSRERTYKLLGTNAYLSLSNAILSKKGKEIVRKDPNLSEFTLMKLLELQKGVLKEVRFYFGEPGYGEMQDVGCALLSTCIKDNPQSTWAEIVGRYADMRRCPFLEIAFGLKKFHEEYGMGYYNKEKRWIPWTPVIVRNDDEEEQTYFRGADSGFTGTEGLIRDIDDYLNSKMW